MRYYIHPREFRPHGDSISVGDEPSGEVGSKIVGVCRLEIRTLSSSEHPHALATKAVRDYLRTPA